MDRLIDSARHKLLPVISSFNNFSNSGRFIERHLDIFAGWENEASQVSVDEARLLAKSKAVSEGLNEIAACVEILRGLRPREFVTYEPKLEATPKTIDFLLSDGDGGRVWVDVKTIRPDWNDSQAAWEQFERAAQHFPENARMIVVPKFCGAALGHNAIATRTKFIEYTVEAEEKERLFTDHERAPVILMFCSDGFSWHKSELGISLTITDAAGIGTTTVGLLQPRTS